jgi:hypothetical protein
VVFSVLRQREQAGVAQLVEQRIRNAKVEGSTPFTGTSNDKGLHLIAGFLVIADFGSIPGHFRMLSSRDR